MVYLKKCHKVSSAVMFTKVCFSNLSYIFSPQVHFNEKSNLLVLVDLPVHCIYRVFHDLWTLLQEVIS